MRDYSGNISAAFEVVDKMRAEGWHLDLTDMVTGWRAVFNRHDIPDPRDPHRNPTEAAALSIDRCMAICMAASMAKGVSEDEIQAAIGEQK